MDRDLSRELAPEVQDRRALEEDLPSAGWVGFAFAIMFVLALGLFFFAPPAGDSTSTTTVSEVSGSQ